MYRLKKLLLAALAAGLLAGCKITTSVPEGGMVVSRTGQYSCGEGETCVFDIENGSVLSDTFIAVPNEGYVFLGWKKVEKHLCGGSIEPCALEGVGPPFTSQDTELFLEPEFSPALTTLDPGSLRFERYNAEDDVLSLLVPSHLDQGSGGSDGVLLSLTEALESPGDRFQEVIALVVGDSPGLPLDGIEGAELISEVPYPLAGLAGTEAVYELALVEFPGVLIKAQYIYLEFQGQTYGLLHLAEDRAFMRNESVVRAMADTLQLGQAVFEDYYLTSDLSDPGKPAIASDGADTLMVTCREATGFGDGSLYGRFLRQDRSMGEEFLIDPDIDTFTNDCGLIQHQLVYTGSQYVLVYLDYIDNRRNIAMRRISRDGTVLDAEPVSVSRATTTDAYSPALAFDGDRALAVWNEMGSDDAARIRGAFIDAAGNLGDPFTVADRIDALYEPDPNIWAYELALASSGNGYLVIWNKYVDEFYSPDAWDRPLWGQALDLDGVAVSAGPVLIAPDNGSNPRYADVVSDGENFLVGWIEGRLDEFSADRGRGSVQLRKLSSAGDLLAPTATSPLEVAGVDFSASDDNGWSPRQFLDLSFDGTNYAALWAATSGDDRGAYVAEISPDLASVSGPHLLPAFGNPSAYVREPNIGYAGDTGIVTWTASVTGAWFFDRSGGIGGLVPSLGVAMDNPGQPKPGTASLSVQDVPGVLAAMEQLSALADTLAYVLDQHSGPGQPGDLVAYCRNGGRVLAGNPVGGVDTLQFVQCAPDDLLDISFNGTVGLGTTLDGTNSQATLLLQGVDLRASRGDSWHQFTGKLAVEQSALNLSDTRLIANLNVTDSAGASYRFVDMAMRVTPASFQPSDVYEYSGRLQLGRSFLNVGSGAAGGPIHVRGRDGAAAELLIEDDYAELRYSETGAQTDAAVRLPWGDIRDGTINLLENSSQSPEPVESSELDDLDVDPALFTRYNTPAGREGASYMIDVLGAVTDADGSLLDYELSVSSVDAITDRGYVIDGETVVAPEFLLTRVDVSRYTLTAQDPGRYNLVVTAIDSEGNAGASRELYLIVIPDTDGDGVVDDDDFDDDGDGTSDFDDDQPKDPNEASDIDGDGIGDNVDTDDDNDGTPDSDDIYPLNENCATAFEANDDGCFVEFVGSWDKFFDGSILYFFTAGELDVPRWDAALERFVEPLRLGLLASSGVPTVARLMADQGRLYFGYDSGLITYVSLDFPEQERWFAQLDNPVTRLEDGVNFLLAFQNKPLDTSLPNWWDQSEVHIGVYNIAGGLISEIREDRFAFDNFYGYDPAQQLYYDEFEEGDLDINTGRIIPEQEKLDTLPLATSPDGRYSLRKGFSSGDIVDMASGNVLASFPAYLPAIRGLVWNDAGLSYVSYGTYYRIDERGTTLEQFEVAGQSSQTSFEYGNGLLVVSDGTYSTDPLIIQVIEIVEDSDGDGASNLEDAFPNKPEASLDEDRDGYPDSWNPGYVDGGDSGLVLDAYPGAVDCYLPEHGDGALCNPASTIESGSEDDQIALDADGVLYFKGRQGRIYRYSLDTDEFLPSLRVGEIDRYGDDVDSLLHVQYSSSDHRLYLSYGNPRPRLTYIDLEEPQTEQLLTELDVYPELLTVTDEYVIVGTGDFSTVRYFYDKSGNFVQTSNEPRSPDSMTWDPANNLLYAVGWPSGVYVESLDPASFTGEATLLADLTINSADVSLSPDGQYFTLGSQEIYNAVDGSVHASLEDLASYGLQYLWLSDGGLARLTYDELRVYGADFQLLEVIDSFPLNYRMLAVFEYDGSLVVVSPITFGAYDFYKFPVP